jgi:hypothetical protein
VDVKDKKRPVTGIFIDGKMEYYSVQGITNSNLARN